MAQIDAVVTQIASIEADDLQTLLPDEREYAASEANAFLVGWLGELGCPVINRPRAGSLSGPPWGLVEWQLAAASIGIPVPELDLAAVLGKRGKAPPRASRLVTVVGDRCIGSTIRLQRWARALAAHTNVDCLTVGFRGRRHQEVFAGAEVMADVSKPAIADALLELVVNSSLAAA